MYTRKLKKPSNSILLLGPRGVGKSSWIKDKFPGVVLYDLLSTKEVLRLEKNPSLLYDELKTLPKQSWVVIDEIQKIPELLNEVQRLIENQELHFLLSGSSARKLKRQGANLLAGRALMKQMFPFIASEVEFKVDAEKAIRYGMLPRAYLADKPAAFLKTYCDTYISEEIKAEALTRNVGAFGRFLEVAARQNGQVTNLSNIARDAQVERPTVDNYFQILIDTLLGFWLPAWKLKTGNKQKVHPKFYFVDSGIARVLTGRGPYPPTLEEKGFLFETWILHELRAFLSYQELNYPLHYWSSHNDVEVDIFFETENGYIAIEVKSGMEWRSKYNNGLLRMKDEFKHKVQCYGIYLGTRRIEVNGVQIYPCLEFLKALWDHKLF